MSNFKTHLQNRDQTARIVEKHLSEIKFPDREMSLAQKNKAAPKKILLFVTQYHPALPNLKDTRMRKCSLRSWRYCVGARFKFWRRSRVPKKGSRDEAIEIPPARKPRYFEWSAHQCAGKRIGRGPYICQSCQMSLRVYFPIQGADGKLKKTYM